MACVRPAESEASLGAGLPRTDLLVSFEGACLYRPWGLRSEWNAVHTLGLHTDRVNREGVADGYTQGFVNLVATSAASGGNVRVPCPPCPLHFPTAPSLYIHSAAQVYSDYLEVCMHQTTHMPARRSSSRNRTSTTTSSRSSVPRWS